MPGNLFLGVRQRRPAAQTEPLAGRAGRLGGRGGQVRNLPEDRMDVDPVGDCLSARREGQEGHGGDEEGSGCQSPFRRKGKCTAPPALRATSPQGGEVNYNPPEVRGGWPFHYGAQGRQLLLEIRHRPPPRTWSAIGPAHGIAGTSQCPPGCPAQRPSPRRSARGSTGWRS